MGPNDGCAAEETTGAKVFMARDGPFDDLDACLAWHSAPIAATGFVHTAAITNIRAEFVGRTAPAGPDPLNGRIALDALEPFCHGINLMREHVKPTVRIHHVVESGGETPNVVPDYTRLPMFIRDVDRVVASTPTRWARELAEGAAMETQICTDVDTRRGGEAVRIAAGRRRCTLREHQGRRAPTQGWC